MIGRAYLEGGKPVIVLIRWGPGGGPRNVLIRRADGQLAVRPFRGLRKPLAHVRRPAGHGARAGDGG